jgi:hypothetical protein
MQDQDLRQESRWKRFLSQLRWVSLPDVEPFGRTLSNQIPDERDRQFADDQ